MKKDQNNRQSYVYRGSFLSKDIYHWNNKEIHKKYRTQCISRLISDVYILVYLQVVFLDYEDEEYNISIL